MQEIDFNEPDLKRRHPAGAGTQKIWRFKNGFGASVVQFSALGGMVGSYGREADLWELGVIKFRGRNILGFKLHYKNPVAKGDVVGHLTEAEVVKLLRRIRSFKKRG